jgi:protocatechuate 3,4-dioxygenase beta subunit
MTKQRVLGAAVVAILVALAIWWTQGRRGGSGGAGGAAADSASSTAGLTGSRGNPREQARVDLHTQPKASMSGTVEDETGAGVAGARVCANGWSKELADEDTRDPSCASSGPDGRYTIGALLPARYSVSAMAPQHEPGKYEVKGEEWSWVRLAAGEDRNGVDITLRTGGVELHGTVKDIGGGTVPDAWVSASPQWRWNAGSAMGRSDADGNFTLWVAKGKVSVTADADGYSSGEKDAIAPGQHVEVLLTPEAVLAGRVVEAGSDRPVPRALVEASGDWSDGNRSSGSAFTDDDGRFRITRIGPGRYKPTAEAVGMYGQSRESVLLALGQTQDDVVIEVYPAFVITGRIVIGDGDGDGEKPCRRGWMSLHERDKDTRRWASSEEDGSVEFRAVLPGTYKVSVNCEKQLEQDEYPEVVVTDADVLDQVWRVQGGARIVGVVKTSDGAGVEGASVRAQVVGGDPRGQRTWGWDTSEDDGAFEMTGLVGGTYNVSADAPNQPEPDEPTKVEVADGAEAKVDIVMPAGGRIEGVVVDERGTPVAGANVRAINKERWGGWRGNTITRDDGTFELEGVRPGELRVVASQEQGWWGGSALRKPGANDDDIAGEQVAIKAGQTEHVRLVVESQSGVIRGRVVDSSGQPVSDAFVDAERESDAAGAAAGGAARSMRWAWSRQPVLTDVDGSFQVEKLAPGKYTVRAFRRGGGEATAEHIDVGGKVTLTIDKPGSIAGTVTIEGGGAPDQFSIAVTDRKAGFSRSEDFFRTGGEWIMRDLPKGEFLVSASAAEGTDKLEMSLAQGEGATGVQLTLAARATVTGTVVALDTGEPLEGFRVMVFPVKGGGGMTYYWGDDEKKQITDAQGRFEVERAPPGRVYVNVSPMNWEEAEYAYSRRLAVVEAGKTTDVGAVKVPRRRTKARERGGDLGFTLKENPPDAEPEDIVHEVALVRPDGPAANTGLVAGDVIDTVDGHAVGGENAYLYWALSNVPEGTTVKFGLKRGETIEIKAAKPL